MDIFIVAGFVVAILFLLSLVGTMQNLGTIGDTLATISKALGELRDIEARRESRIDHAEIESKAAEEMLEMTKSRSS